MFNGRPAISTQLPRIFVDHGALDADYKVDALLIGEETSTLVIVWGCITSRK